jgi:hypothetical protein
MINGWGRDRAFSGSDRAALDEKAAGGAGRLSKLIRAAFAATCVDVHEEPGQAGGHGARRLLETCGKPPRSPQGTAGAGAGIVRDTAGCAYETV